MALKLLIGNKNYSSWSFRPWFAMKVVGIAFEEAVVPLFEPGSAEEIHRHSPAGKVPALVDDGRQVWDSLSILEYLAEKFPAKKLWPDDAGARAQARSISAEMHSGFTALRSQCPMNMRRPIKRMELNADARANAARIDAIWGACRAQYGKVGPFLFGAFTAADAMYAPVVARFHTYAVEASAVAKDYMAGMMALPAWKEWQAAGVKEPWVISHDEVDWPQVLKA